MPITQERVQQTETTIFDTSEFPAEQIREAPGSATTDSVVHFQFIREATIFIQHRVPKYLTEVVPVWYLRAKIKAAVDAVLATTGAYIDSVRDLLAGQIAQERSDREAGDTRLHEQLTTEANQRIAGDNNLQTALNTETAARTAADTALGGRIEAETQGRIAADTVEAQARQAGDAALQTNIDLEAGARIAGDTTLQNNIDAEARLRAQGDTGLQANIDREATARQAADAVLQTDIDNEAAARIASDNILQGNINAEAGARTAGDTALLSQINQEAADRAAAITAEAAARIAGDNAEATARIAGDQQLSDAIAAVRAGFLPPIQLVQVAPYTLGTPMPATLNGVAVEAGMRMLLTAQADPTQNRVAVLDNPATGEFHWAPDNIMQGAQYNYTSGGDYQGYSWVLSNPIDRDPTEGTDTLGWTAMVRPDQTLAGTYTTLTGRTLDFNPATFSRLLREQAGILPPIAYLLGDGGTGGTIQPAGDGNSYVIVDYAPLLGVTEGTLDYYSKEARYIANGANISGIRYTPINKNQVRVDFIGVQAPNIVRMVLGGMIVLDPRNFEPTTGATTNIPIANAGFELGRISNTDWLSGGTEISVVGASHSGAYALRNGGNYSGIRQTIPVQPNTRYELTVWATANAADRQAIIIDNYGGSRQEVFINKLFVGNAPTTVDYQQYRIQFTTGANNRSVDIGQENVNGGTAVSYVDDFALASFL